MYVTYESYNNQSDLKLHVINKYHHKIVWLAPTWVGD